MLHFVEELIDGVEDRACADLGGEPLGGGEAFDNIDEDVGSDSGVGVEELLILIGMRQRGVQYSGGRVRERLWWRGFRLCGNFQGSGILGRVRR